VIGFVLRPLRGVVRTLAALPAVVEAVLVLPTLARQLEDVKAQTAALPDILTELERVRSDTITLPVINAHLERVERNTLAVEQLTAIALPLQGAAVRVGRFADRLPQRRSLREPPA
jgi:hypothetical protein